MQECFTKEVLNKMRPWLVVLSAASFFFLISSSTNFNTVTPYLITNFHFNAEQIGFLFACYYYTNIIFVFWAGIILDKASTRKILIISFVVANCSILVFAITKSLVLMALSRLVLGVVGSFSLLICFQLIKRWFPYEKTAMVTGIVITYATFGGLFSQTPLMLAIENLGWKAGLLLNFWLGTLFCVFALLFAQDFPLNTRQQISNSKIVVWQAIKRTITNYQNWLVGFCAALFSLPMLFFSASWGIIYLQQVGNFTEIESSYVVNAIIIGTVTGSTLIGWLSDRFYTRRIPLVSSAFFTIIILLIVTYVTRMSLLSYIALFFLFGLILSAQVVIFPLVAENNPRFLVGTATGFVAALTALGGVGMQFLSRLMDHSYLYVMWLLIGAIVIGAVLMLFIKESQKQNI